MRLTEADHVRVSEAVKAAELRTDGEIVTIVAAKSDGYGDVAAHWALLAMLLPFALVAAFPAAAVGLVDRLFGAWGHVWSPATLLTIELVVAVVVFLIVRLLLSSMPLRMALTPAATKSRRVRRQALALFRASAEHRTVAATGVLLYLSLAEHRAELIADAGIHARVEPELWGEAMAALVAATRDGRPGDGMAAAVTMVGDVLAIHFPRGSADTNELPDRLIEL